VSSADNPYVTLGVGRDASPEDIKLAYRKLAKKHHPDLNPGNAAAEAQFKKVSAANQILSDPEKRGRFDRGEIDGAGQEQAPRSYYRDFAEGEPGQRYGAHAGASEQWDADDLSSVFSQMFGQRGRHPGGRPEAPSARGEDLRYILSIDFLEAVNGATRHLAAAEGRGELNVKIPPGTADHHVLRVRGKGGAGWNGGPNGDMLIEIQVMPHRFFTREDQNIRLDLPISLSEAVLGGMIEVPTPGGTVRMRVPAHSDTGSELRLRGRGVPAHGKHPAGDLFARLQVVVGTKDPALEAFLRQWTPEIPPVNPRQSLETQE